MKKIVIAMDSFKGSMSSLEAGHAAERGIRRALPDSCIVVRPVADGGEGTTEALADGMGGCCVSVDVTGPLGKPVTATYGIIPDRGLAVIEMAQAAGIMLVDRNAFNPLEATTYGVGEMICDAVHRGCREFIIGIGGSATTDGGVGMLMALGFTFLDADGAPIPQGIQALDEIETISDTHSLPELRECRFQVACDVSNPLLGENGAVFVYGPQKGVKEEQKQLFDDKMAHYAEKTAVFAGRDERLHAGAGAAGGLGFAFLSYLDADVKPGISIVLNALELEDTVRDADIVVTGEGQMDAQTAMGKVPVGVAGLAKKYGCIVVALAGGVTRDAVKCNDKGIDAFFPIVRGVTDLDTAMDKETAMRNMEETAEQVFRLIRRLGGESACCLTEKSS